MKVDLIKVDDWQALYVDGVCVYQGHEVTVEDVIDALNVEGANIDFDSCYLNDDGEEFIGSVGSMPDNLKEIPKAFF